VSEDHAPQTPSVNCKTDAGWIDSALSALDETGFVAIEDVVDASFLDRVRKAMYRAEDRVIGSIGRDRVIAAGDGGVVRLMMDTDPVFFEFLTIPEVLAVVDRAVAPTAILRLQNGLILRPAKESLVNIFGSKFHQDFPFVLNGYRVSINLMFAIDDYHAENGATLVIPGSHQILIDPDTIDPQDAVAVTCPSGSMILFDSTLWHCAGKNHTDRDRLAINHQFTRSWIKPQMDYVRALGDDVVQSLPDRSQQLLGWYTRVVTTLDEYYRPTEERLYRAGQG
jgi:ectoine hydroxylase-related dioxygenase (phytanoyl-CoA dioxygenase family)